MASGARGNRRSLDDPRFEHDACGVGFVAEPVGAPRDRVLPLALAGLAALGHRGAFGADGESSDGAGVPLPLTRELAEHLASRPAGRSRPGDRQLFLPRGRDATRRGRRALVRPRSPRRACRSRAGARSRSTTARSAQRRPPSRPPIVAQAIVAGPPGVGPSRLRAPPRPRSAAARAGCPGARRLAELSVPSASARTVVYKGLVAGDRLARALPRPRAPARRVRTRCSTSATRRTRRPIWRLAQPFRLHRPQRRDQHGPRQPRSRSRGRRATALRGRLPRAPRRRPAAQPGRLRLAVARRGARAPLATGWDRRRRSSPRFPRPCRCAVDARTPRSPRSSAARPGSWRRGTGRRRSSSPTAGASARYSTGTGCGRWPGRSPRTASSRRPPRRAPCRSRPPRSSGGGASGRASCCSSIRGAA